MNTISSLFNWLGNLVGADPNTLTTTSKTLVGAINEVDGDISTINSRPYITESGTVTSPATSTAATPPDDHNGASGTWTYRKWSDGTAEAWCQSAPKTLAAADWVYWGEIREAIIVDTGINFPSGLFVSAPYITATAIPTSGYTLISAEMSIATNTDLSKQTPKVYGVRGNAPQGSMTAVVNFYAIGKWQ